MNLAIEILNKEIERREILLAVENNVLIQNDMSNEIGVLKDSVKNLSLSGVSHQRELLETVLSELDMQVGTNYSADVNLIDTIEHSL